jgi:AcrR family transcriptional regulator
MSNVAIDQAVPLRLSRQERKQRTRQRLIDAVTSIVCEEGIEALTTTRLTQYAQITQPGFYVHFKNIDHCLGVAAEQIYDKLYHLQAEARKRAYAKIRIGEGFDNAELVPATFAEMLIAVLSETRLSEICVRYRHDRSPLGQSMRKVTEHVRFAVREDALRVAKNSGVQEERYPRFELLAELVASMFIGALEACIEKRCADPTLMIEISTRFIRTAIVSEIALATE